MRRTTSSAVNIGAISRHLDTQLSKPRNLSPLNVSQPQAWNFRCVIPELYIWRAAALMPKRYGDKALEQSSARANELTGDGDQDGADTSRRITTAVAQHANTTQPAPPH